MRPKLPPTLAVLACGLGLGACNSASGTDAAICDGAGALSVAQAAQIRTAALRKPRTPIQTAAVERAYAEACLRRWSYRLSVADVGLDDLRLAVLTRCEAEISGWTRAQQGTASTGDVAAVVRDAAGAHATLFAVQAKAGRCRAAHD